MPPTDPLEIVAQALNRQAGVSDWQAQRLIQRSAQRFLIGNKTETQRLVATEQVQTRIYNDHIFYTQSTTAAHTGVGGTPEDGFGGGTPLGAVSTASGAEGVQARGATSRILLPEEIADQARLHHAIEEAVYIARLTDNPPYTLPTPPLAGYPAVATVDAALAASDDSRLAALSELSKRLQDAAAAEPGIRLSSAELFATASEITLRSSRGIAARRSETDIFCDLVLLASNETQTAEYHVMPRRRRLADLNIEEVVQQSAGYARESLRAATPSTHDGPVVISGEALIALFSPLIFHSSARAAYQSLSRFAL
ncbi:MAG TPA: hypothetical protein VH590_02175, partial [Ktedonobacterales bacterium]